MKYLVCRKQKADGCDYTIGCGMVFEFVEAASEAELVEKIIYPDGRDERCTLLGEFALSEILIAPADSVKIVEVAKLAERERREAERARAEAENARELAELRRLQEKWGAGAVDPALLKKRESGARDSAK